MDKIQINNLTTEIKVALEEVFVAEITQTQGKILLKFENGQQFTLSVEEN